jgi:hypothetical protein
MKNRPGFRCCVCGQPATLHEVAKGCDRRPFGIRHHIQLPLCSEHHDVAHGKYGMSQNHDVFYTHWLVGKRFELYWIDRIYGENEYNRIMPLVKQRDHAELEKTDSERLKRLMEYCE